MNERGTALPLALLALAICGSLMVALASLSGSEPTIANNHMLSNRARGFAEAGVERALWAANNLAAAGLSDPLPASMPAPYDGSQFVVVDQTGGTTLGGYILTMTPDATDPNLVHITSVGYAPDSNAPRAIKKIQVDAMRVKFGAPPGTPPCALCLGGETPPAQQSSLQVGGNATVTASSTARVPATYCSGQTPTGAILSTGTVAINGQPDITAPSGGATITQGAPVNTFTPFTLTDVDMQVLKSMAQSKGTYYQGSQTWTAPPPDGLVFVDTPSGQPLTSSSPTSDRITVSMHGNWSAGWSGWMIIAGSVNIQGNMRLTGLIYVQNDFSYNGTGTGQINGALVAQNRLDAVASQADSTDRGNGQVVYNCPALRDGGGAVSTSWFPKPGTYKEAAGT